MTQGAARRGDPGPPPEGSVVREHSALVLVRGTPRARRVHVPPSTSATLYLVVLFTLWVLNLGDLLITMHWTGNVGWAAEGNGIMRQVAHVLGPTGFVLYKVLLMTFVVLVLWWLFVRFEAESVALRTPWKIRALEGMRWTALGMTLVLLGFYTWVIWNNLHISGLV